jgi:hypothetical protein
MTDVPTLTNATTANYATWNPLINGDSATNGNLSVTNDTARGTQELLKYDAYWEITSTGGTTTAGVVSGTGTTNTTTVADTKTYGFRLTTTGTLDYINITDGGSFTNITTGLTAQQFPYASAAAATTGSFNAGQRPFAATPPTGFVALNTFNLPASTIVKGNVQMDATLYTGNGSTQTITNAAAFQPDLVWVKSRSVVRDNRLVDSVRGATKNVRSNTTNAEDTETDGLVSFNSNGFGVGANTGFNESAASLVGWQWKGGGAAVSNTDGSITSQVSVNASAGFSVVTYTGTGANATVGHGLGVAPKMVIAKRRNTTGDWYVHHNSIAAANTLYLNLTNAATSSPTTWNSTAPTSSVFSVGTNVAINGNTNTFVAYCWSEIDGFSKFGSYTGNGSADGPFVYLGFRPRWILIKRSTDATNWRILDTSRNTSNIVNKELYPSMSDAEFTLSTLDIVSNGFKIRTTELGFNASGGTYIYMAFAENPFKFSLAR